MIRPAMARDSDAGTSTQPAGTLPAAPGCQGKTVITAPVYAFLTPTLPDPVDGATKKTFYYGIASWTPQWATSDASHRTSLSVPTTAVDLNHKIATLRTCIANTVQAYKDAVTQINNQFCSSDKRINHGLGHGAAADPTNKSVTTADFGAQLGAFHTPRVSRDDEYL